MAENLRMLLAEAYCELDKQASGLDDTMSTRDDDFGKFLRRTYAASASAMKERIRAALADGDELERAFAAMQGGEGDNRG